MYKRQLINTVLLNLFCVWILWITCSEEMEDLERPVPRQISLFFITLLSLLVSVADRLAEPVLEQYVYQVYTDHVYGNASRKVHITRTPCLNTSASHADKLRDEVSGSGLYARAGEHLLRVPFTH